MESEANEVLGILEKAGFSAYIVGGYVRDKLLGKPVQDIDLATSATPAEVSSLFPKVIPTGMKHGTLTVLWKGKSFEITTFRKETSYSDQRHPDRVEFVKDITVDLARRDFTINAMAVDRAGNVVDPFDGRKDLNQGLIRAVGDPWIRFQEDPLRILRGIRFAASLQFGIEQQTWKAMKESGHWLANISRERIRDEFRKMIEGKAPLQAILLLAEPGILPFQPWSGVFTTFLAHPAKDGLCRFADPSYRWALICSTGDNREEIDWYKILMEWKFPKRLASEIQLLLAIKQQPMGDPIMGKKLILSHGLDTVKKGFYLRQYTEPKAEAIQEETLARWNQEIVIRDPKELDLNAEDLIRCFQKEPGPWIGRTIGHLFEEVALGRIPNNKADLMIEAGRCMTHERRNPENFQRG